MARLRPPSHSWQTMHCQILCALLLLHTTKGQSAFTIASGNGCELTQSGDCVQTTNYPTAQTSNSQPCTISVGINGALQVVGFDIEARSRYTGDCSAYEWLKVQGVKICGTFATDNQGPNNAALSAGDQIEWLSDAWSDTDGFKICLVYSRLPACAATAGNALNPSNCSCGNAECTTATGLYCVSIYNRCNTVPLPACAIANGTAANPQKCMCGMQTCATTTGLFCDIAPEKGNGQCSFASDSWFVQVSSATCDIVPGRITVHDLDVCYAGSLLVGWQDSDDLVHSYASTTRPPGCWLSKDKKQILRNTQMTSKKVCGYFSTTCLCFLGPLCANTNGGVPNIASCRCGTEICSIPNGLVCLASANTCSYAKCPITNGMSANAKSCTCGTSVCTSSAFGLYCLLEKNSCGGKCKIGTEFDQALLIQGSSDSSEMFGCKWSTFGTNWCGTRAAQGAHTLSPQQCNFTTQMTVQANDALKLVGGATVPTVLSGGKTTRFFVVFGQLTLVNLILKDGQSSEEGGAFLVESIGSLLHLIRSVVRDCSAEFGGAVVIQDGAEFVMENSTLELNKARGDDSVNEVLGEGGAVYAKGGSRVTVVPGTMSFVQGNQASHNGGGFYLKEALTRLDVKGHLVVQNNWLNVGGNGGGLYAEEGSSLIISSGACLDVIRNTAPSQKHDVNRATQQPGNGGGLFLSGSSLRASDYGTQLLILGNSAGQNGGGVSAILASFLVVSLGARLDVVENTATNGGGLFLEDVNARLDVGGIGTVALLQNNSAKQFGGGMYGFLSTVATVSSGSRMDVIGNTAAISGGGIYLQDPTPWDTDLANNPPEDGKMYCQDLIPDSFGGRDSPSTCYDRTLCYPPQETKCKKYIETRNHNGDLVTDELEQHLRFSISGSGTKLNIADNTAVQQGGGFWFSGQSSLKLALGAHLNITNNTAECGGGVYMQDLKTTFDVSGNDTHLLIMGNAAGKTGGGMHATLASSFTLSSDATMDVIANAAVATDGGGIFLQDYGTRFDVSGMGTELNLQDNTAGQKGGGLCASLASLTLSSGAFFRVVNNTAMSEVGGGMQMHGTGMGVSGNGTRLVVQNNSAKVSGGGVWASTAPQAASLLQISSGAHFDVTNNVADLKSGGGIYLEGQGTRLDVVGASSQFLIQSNSATLHGGGVAISTGAVLRTTSPSTFQSNAALQGDGGALSYDDKDGEEDGGSSCVRLSLWIRFSMDVGGLGINNNIGPDRYTGAEGEEIFDIELRHLLQVSTTPKSTLFLSVPRSRVIDKMSMDGATLMGIKNDDERIPYVNKNVSFCVPCGKYDFEIGTFKQNVFFPKDSFVQLIIGRNPFENKDDVILVKTGEFPGGGWNSNRDPVIMIPLNGTKYTQAINIPCAEQGTILKHVRFQDNHARLNGGAIATPANYKNTFFQVENVSFVNNSAIGKGGAIYISGPQTAMHIMNSTFDSNAAKNAAGGALSVESSAGLQMFRVKAQSNSAGGNGDGGFLFAQFANPILLSDTSIGKCFTDEKGGGGGIAVYSTKLALEKVTIEHCQAGRRGGGGIKLASAEAHLFECTLNDNVANSGGHVNIAASTLVVHNKNVEMIWPSSKPMFPETNTMKSTQGNSMTKGVAAVSGGGAIACMASLSKNVLVLYKSKEEGLLSCQSSLYGYAKTSPFEKLYVCPYKGIYVGTSTIIEQSTARDGGGAVAATLCAIEMSHTFVANSTSANGNGAGVLLSSESTLMVDGGSTFTNNRATQGSGGAISCDKCDAMVLSEKTLFISNTAHMNGGALHLTSPKESVTSAGSVFINNAARMNGGAVSSDQGSYWSIGDRYEENCAVSGSGGALSMTSSHLKFDATTVCRENHATKGGGGCILWNPEGKNIQDNKWNVFKPQISNMSSLQHNRALFGSSLATPGVSLRIVNNTKITTNQDNILQPYYPTVELLDWYESVVQGILTNDVEITAEILKSQHTDANLFGATLSKANQHGTATFEDLGLQGIPGSGPHLLSFKSGTNSTAVSTNSESSGGGGGIETYLQTTTSLPSFIHLCPINTYLDGDQCSKCRASSTSPIGSTSSKECICNPGSYLFKSNCIFCEDDKYLNNTSIHEIDWSCANCPRGAVCKGNIDAFNMKPYFGWSRCPSLDKEHRPWFEPCSFSASCLGESNAVFENKFEDGNGNDPAMVNQNESCSTPYRNNSLLCASCASNFSQSGLDAKCEQCPDPTTNTAIAVVGMLAVAALLPVYVYLTLSDEGEIKPEDGAQSIGLSFIQIISLLVTFPIAWPQIFVTLFQIGGSVTTVGQHLVNLKCMYPLQSEADVFFSTRIAWSILPFLLVVACVLAWFFLSKCRKISNWKSNARASVVALLFLIWPGLCSETFAIFACRDVCGNNVMIVDLNEPCWEGRHAKYAVLAFFMLVFYVLGFPLLSLINIKQMHNHAIETNQEIQELEGYLTWGMFVSAYHPKVWWWEGTVAMRKIVIAAIGVFGAEMGEMQISVTLFLMVIVMLMTAIVQPFGNHLMLQFLELGTLAVTWGALWAGSVFNVHPRCEDGNGGTFAWCDALSILISALIVLCVLMSIAVVVYYKKQEELHALWDKKCKAKIENIEHLVHASRLRSAMNSLGEKGERKKKKKKKKRKKNRGTKGEKIELSQRRPSVSGPQRAIQIYTDPKTKRRYSHNSKSGVTAWLEDNKEREREMAVEVEAGIEMVGNPMKRGGGEGSNNEVVIDVPSKEKEKTESYF